MYITLLWADYFAACGKFVAECALAVRANACCCVLLCGKRIKTLKTIAGAWLLQGIFLPLH
jgi:hypothetical protein